MSDRIDVQRRAIDAALRRLDQPQVDEHPAFLAVDLPVGPAYELMTPGAAPLRLVLGESFQIDVALWANGSMPRATIRTSSS